MQYQMIRKNHSSYGIRVGTPSVTRRGSNENDVRELAGWMCDVLDALGKENEEQVIAETKEKY